MCTQVIHTMNKIRGRVCMFWSICSKCSDLTLQWSNTHYPKEQEIVLCEFWIQTVFQNWRKNMKLLHWFEARHMTIYDCKQVDLSWILLCWVKTLVSLLAQHGLPLRNYGVCSSSLVGKLSFLISHSSWVPVLGAEMGLLGRRTKIVEV